MGDINNNSNSNTGENLDPNQSFANSEINEPIDLNGSNDTNQNADNLQTGETVEEPFGQTYYNGGTEGSPDTEGNPDKEPGSYMDPLDYSGPASVQPGDIPRKKMNGKLLALLIALAVVLVGSITAFANRNAIANTISRLTKSPAEYYAYIEQKGMNAGIDKLTASYDRMLANYDKQVSSGVTQDANLKLTVNPQLTGMLGLNNFESIEAAIRSTASKDGNSKSSVGLSYNGTSLISTDMYMNAETSEMLMIIPELSSSYLLFPLDEIMEASGAYPDGFSYSEYLKDLKAFLKDDKLSPETLNSLLKKYSSLIINNIDNVTIGEDTTLTASDISGTYTTLSAEITGEDAYNIGMAILNEAKDDNTVKELCEVFNICTKEEYDQAIKDAISDLEADKDSYSADDAFVMNVYVDKNGNIMGREFKDPSDDSAGTFTYYITRKGNDIGFDYSLTTDANSKLFSLTGKAAVKNGSYTGNCTLDFSDGSGTQSIDIDFEDAGIVKDKGYINGKYTISSALFSGMKLVFDCTADQKQQKIVFTVNSGSMEMASLEITGKEADYEDFTLPSDSEQVIDGFADMDSYLETVDYTGFISKLEDALGIDDLGSYFGYLLPGYTY